MPKQATKKSTTTSFQKFRKKTFAITGKLQQIQRDRAKQLIEMEGGKLVDDVTVKVDYLVAGATPSGNPSAAEKKAGQLNQNKGAAIQVMSESDSLALFSPTRDEAIAMLKGARKGLNDG